MPNDSRADRRRRSLDRENRQQHPQHDPMRSVYIAIGVVVLVVIAIFGFMRWNDNRRIAAAYATPTPAPVASGVATPKPIQLVDGTAIGINHFHLTDKQLPVTRTGAHGDPIDGITCAGMEFQVLHVHSHLSIFDHGKQIQVPRLLGATNTPTGGCLYWIHTHDASGIIHVEAPRLDTPSGAPFTLGILFDEWGQPLSYTQVADMKGPVTAFVNGTPYTGDLKAIPLSAHQQITLEIGTPVVTPPTYLFPPNE